MTYVDLQASLHDLRGHAHLFAQRGRVVHGECEHGLDDEARLDRVRLQYPDVDQADVRDVRVPLATDCMRH